MDGPMVEHEICANCKKEIPNFNYVMHMAHCARNITLCTTCKEPIPKNQFEEHKKSCAIKAKKVEKPAPLPLPIENNKYYADKKAVEEKKIAARKERQFQKYEKLVDTGYSLKNNGAKPKKEVQLNKNGLLACKYCELELPQSDMDEHENYCGSRTDKCSECGELVMFKYKQLHLDSNHNFLKLSEEPGPKPSWESTTPLARRSRSDVALSRPRPASLRPFTGFDSTLYNFPESYSPPRSVQKPEKSESYKEISRRLDCKTEYIRNLLHDSASITVPLRHNGAVPRNHFNHHKGPAPQPPRRSRNPPTELTIPCEFCDTPIPHSELILHETGCRPDLARINPRRRADTPEDDDYFVAPPQPSSPEVELPCEFCADMIPASQLLRHQATCN